MGGAMIIQRSIKTKQNKKIFKIGQKFGNLLNHIWPFNICYNRLSQIKFINSGRDGFMCQSVKMSKFIPLSLRLSGIEFSLVWD